MSSVGQLASHPDKYTDLKSRERPLTYERCDNVAYIKLPNFTDGVVVTRSGWDL